MKKLRDTRVTSDEAGSRSAPVSGATRDEAPSGSAPVSEPTSYEAPPAPAPNGGDASDEAPAVGDGLGSSRPVDSDVEVAVEGEKGLEGTPPEQPATEPTTETLEPTLIQSSPARYSTQEFRDLQDAQGQPPVDSVSEATPRETCFLIWCKSVTVCGCWGLWKGLDIINLNSNDVRNVKHPP